MNTDLALRIYTVGADGVRRELGQLEGAVSKVGRASDDAGAGADRLSSAIGRVAHYGVAGGLAALSGGALSGVSRALVDASVQAERLAMGLQFATGSAPSEIKYLREITQQLGLQFSSTASAYMSFAAAVRQTKLEGEGARRVFEAVSKASAVMGLSAEQNQGALLALQQMISKGTVSAEELRGQLGERLPGAFQVAARSMGVTTQELGKMLEQGQLLSEDFLPKFARQLEQELGGAADKAADRLEGSINRMSNAWARFKETFAADAGVKDGAGWFAKSLANDLTAVTEAMDRSRGSGSQFAQVLGLIVGRAAGLGNIAPAFMTTTAAAQETGARLKEADEKLSLLRAGLATNPGSILLSGAIQDTERLILRLREAELLTRMLDQTGAESRRLGLTGPESQSGAETARLARGAATLAAGDKRSEILKQYASDAAKLEQELMRVREAFKGMIPPEIESEIRKKFVNKDAVAAIREEGKAWDEATKEYLEYRQKVTEGEAVAAMAQLKRAEAAEQAVDAQLKFGADALAAIQRETAALKMNTTEREIAAAMYALEERGIKAGTAAYEEYADQIRRAIVDRDAVKASIEGANAIAAEWKRASGEIERGLTDALMRGFEGGKGFIENFKSVLVNAFKTMVLRPIIEAQVRGGSSVVGNFLGTSGGQGGGFGGLMSNFSSAYSGAGGGMQGAWSGAKGAWSSLSGMYGGGAGGAGGAVNSYLTTGGVEGSIVGGGTGGGAGSVGGGMTGAIGAAGWAALAYVVAKKAVSDSQRGFNRDQAKDVQGRIGGYFGTGGFESDFANGLEKLGMNKRWADILSGSTAVAKLLGYSEARVTDQGFIGSISGGGVDARAFQNSTQRVGTVRRYLGGEDKKTTDYAALGADLAGLLDQSAADVLAGVNAWAKTLGLPAERLAGISTQIRVSMTGDSAKDQAAIMAAFESYQNDLVKGYEGVLTDLRKFGESTVETLQRLAGLQQFSDILNSMGGIFSRIAGLGVDARESMIALAGGMDNLSQQAQSFIGNYYNRDEIAGGRAREIQTALSDAGITADFTAADPRAQFRQLVEGVNVSTEEGRTQLATLLSLQQSFAGVADYLTETGRTLSDTALLAPAMDSLLGPLLTSGTDAQVGATNGVRDAVNDLSSRLIEAMEEIARLAAENQGEPINPNPMEIWSP